MSITDSGAMRQEVLAERSGRCYVCGFQGRFELLCRSRREGFLCPGCRASLRYQHQAQTIVDLYGHRDTPSLSALAKDPQLAELTIYEPGVIGPYRKLW